MAILICSVASSSGGGTYDIKYSTRDGKTYCTCRGWIAAGKISGGGCKHFRNAQVSATVRAFQEVRHPQRQTVAAAPRATIPTVPPSAAYVPRRPTMAEAVAAIPDRRPQAPTPPPPVAVPVEVNPASISALTGAPIVGWVPLALEID